jgi:hypothetical protein
MKISSLAVAVASSLCVTTSHAWVTGAQTRKGTALRATLLDGEEIRGPITPLGNFCLVKTKDTLSSTDGGILLPDQVR